MAVVSPTRRRLKVEEGGPASPAERLDNAWRQGAEARGKAGWTRPERGHAENLTPSIDGAANLESLDGFSRRRGRSVCFSYISAIYLSSCFWFWRFI